MGVKDLWNILSVSCEKKSLWELQGLIIAIDLSSWIVDSQNVKAVDKAHLNMYLRNLFFRTSYLLLLGVKPIFILEGKAPVLKHGTIAQRQKNIKELENPKPRSGNRGRLNVLQKKCEELLLSLGVRCFKSEGEAEALCAKLNELGVVDAVISQDSDCFLYGAKVVLRNFTMSPSYTCDMYTMVNIESKLSLGRQKLLALSLLCGCDYEAGVEGVGKQSALKFLSTLRDEEVLARLRSWRDNPLEENCVNFSQMTLEEKLEHNIRKKTKSDPNFPSEEVISEFLSFKTKHIPTFEWIKPSLPKFAVIADRMLAWEHDYICSKFMPLVTRWHLLHNGAECGLKLESIVKIRKIRGTACYQIQWQFEGVGVVNTEEPCNLVEKVYPEMHMKFVKSKEKPKKGSKKKNKKDCVDELENVMGRLSIGDQPKKQVMKSSHRSKEKGLQTLHRFILQNKPNNPKENEFKSSTPMKDNCLLNDFFGRSESENTPLLTRGDSTAHKSPDKQENVPFKSSQPLVHSLFDSDVDTDEFDFSDIISTIVSRSSPNPAIKMWSNNKN